MTKPNAALALPLGDRDDAPSQPGSQKDAATSQATERKPRALIKLEAEWEELFRICSTLQARIATDRKRHKAVFRTEDRLVKTRVRQMVVEREIEKQRRRIAA